MAINLDPVVTTADTTAHSSLGTGEREFSDTLNAHDGAIGRLDRGQRSLGDTATAHEQTLQGQQATLAEHDSRLEALERPAMQADERRTMTPAESSMWEDHITDAENAHAGTVNPPESGHGSMDARLQQRIAQEPEVRMASRTLQHKITTLKQTLDTGNASEVQKAGEEMNQAVSQLNAVRRAMESNGVFQAGNKYSRNVTAVNGTLATLSVAGAATTGGIIAWNNKKQGDKA